MHNKSNQKSFQSKAGYFLLVTLVRTCIYCNVFRMSCFDRNQFQSNTPCFSVVYTLYILQIDPHFASLYAGKLKSTYQNWINISCVNLDSTQTLLLLFAGLCLGTNQSNINVEFSKITIRDHFWIKITKSPC